VHSTYSVLLMPFFQFNGFIVHLVKHKSISMKEINFYRNQNHLMFIHVFVHRSLGINNFDQLY